MKYSTIPNNLISYIISDDKVVPHGLDIFIISDVMT